MSNAALTPRVRTIVVCDEAVRSEIEDQVFTLEGVRTGFGAESFPCTRALAVYLLLTYPRDGNFPGEVKVVPEESGKAMRMAKFQADFDGASAILPMAIPIHDCTFPAPGRYSVEVHFWTDDGDVQKGEYPVDVWQIEE